METNCSAKAYDGSGFGRFYPCKKKATIEREGKSYCKIHDPEYIKQKEEARTVKYNEAWRKRRIELSGHLLLKACKNALEVSHDPAVEKILMEAIAKAESK